MERVKQGFRAGLKLVWILCVPLFLAYFLAGRYLVFLFMDNSTGPAIDTGIQFLRILSPFYFVVSAKLVADGILRGAGLMRNFMIATFTDLILRGTGHWTGKSLRFHRNLVRMARSAGPSQCACLYGSINVDLGIRKKKHKIQSSMNQKKEPEFQTPFLISVVNSHYCF